MTDEKPKYYKVVFYPPHENLAKVPFARWCIYIIKYAKTGEGKQTSYWELEEYWTDMDYALDYIEKLEAEGYIKCPI